MENRIDILVEFEVTGNMKKSMNLISQYHLITLGNYQYTAHERYTTKLGVNDAILA